MGQSDAERWGALVRVIEGEIVPRLLLSLAASRSDASPASNCRLADAGDVTELVRLLLWHDGAVAANFVQIVRERGMPPESICRELLAPAARRLGQLWEQHQCDLGEFSVGLGRLQNVLRQVRSAA